MTSFKRLSTLSFSAVILGTGIAQADVTASGVWADWKDYLTAFGYEVTGTERQSGGSLYVTDITLTADLADQGVDGTFEVTVPEFSFNERGDGTVQIDVPTISVMEITSSAEGEDFTAKVEYAHTGLDIIAAGDAGAITYTYAAPSVAVRLAGLAVEGETIDPDIARTRVSFTDLAGTTSVTAGDLRETRQNMTASDVSIDVFFQDPENADASVDMDIDLSGVSTQGTSAIPTGLDADGDVNAMLDAGMAVAGTLSFTQGEATSTFKDEGNSGTFGGTSQGGSLDFSMSSSGLVYDLKQDRQTFNMVISDLPFPVSADIAESGLTLQFPLKKAEEAQDFAFGFRLLDFTISDAIWGLFDPSRQLPRDPASLEIDLAGKANVLFDFLDPATAAVLEDSGAMPGELETLTLNSLLLRVAGAALTGNGSFTFNNDDTSTFGGFPRPEGKVDLALSGGNGLLDKLVGIGLLPEDQAMGARMMLGLFARPGDGPDALVSTLEINKEGHVLANGQRIQ